MFFYKIGFERFVRVMKVIEGGEIWMRLYEAFMRPFQSLAPSEAHVTQKYMPMMSTITKKMISVEKIESGRRCPGGGL